MRIYLPLVAADVAEVVLEMADDPLPNYLRLNAAAEIPETIPAFAPWRRLKRGRNALVIGMGPVLQGLWHMGAHELLDELEVWSVGTFPLAPLPAELSSRIQAGLRVFTLEEHYRPCGLGEAMSYLLLSSQLIPKSFSCLHADGYPSGRYGSQRWHQEENGLAGPALASRLEVALRA
jgi:transketolase